MLRLFLIVNLAIMLLLIAATAVYAHDAPSRCTLRVGAAGVSIHVSHVRDGEDLYAVIDGESYWVGVGRSSFSGKSGKVMSSNGWRRVC